jgi:hypothetical protein
MGNYRQRKVGSTFIPRIFVLPVPNRDMRTDPSRHDAKDNRNVRSWGDWYLFMTTGVMF